MFCPRCHILCGLLVGALVMHLEMCYTDWRLNQSSYLILAMVIVNAPVKSILPACRKDYVDVSVVLFDRYQTVSALLQIIVLARVIVDADHVTLSARGVTVLVDLLQSTISSTIILTGKKQEQHKATGYRFINA